MSGGRNYLSTKISSSVFRIEYVVNSLYGNILCGQQPSPHSPTGDLGDIAGVNGQNSKGLCQGGKVSLTQENCILMYVCVAPSTPVGVWSTALGLRWHISVIINSCMKACTVSFAKSLESVNFHFLAYFSAILCAYIIPK